MSTDHLAYAAQVRAGIADVRRAVRTGTMTISEALDDPRAQRMRIGDLLAAQRLSTPAQIDEQLHGAACSPLRRIEHLTARGRRAVLDSCSWQPRLPLGP